MLASDKKNPVVNDLLPQWIEKQVSFLWGRLDKDTRGAASFHK